MTLAIKKKSDGAIIAQGSEQQKTAHEFEGNWYFAPDAVDMQYLTVTNRTYTCPYKGTCYWLDMQTPEGRVVNAAWVYDNPKPGYEFIKDQIGFYVRNTEVSLAVSENNQESVPSAPTS